VNDDLHRTADGFMLVKNRVVGNNDIMISYQTTLRRFLFPSPRLPQGMTRKLLDKGDVDYVVGKYVLPPVFP
jgi:hypothetical protein